MTRDSILELLKTGVCEVSFVKLNGDTRVMPCTLHEDIIPGATASDPASQKKVRELNEEIVVAWCTDANAWRSFRVANVLAVTPPRVLSGGAGI